MVLVVGVASVLCAYHFVCLDSSRGNIFIEMNLNEAIATWKMYDGTQGLDVLLTCRQTITSQMWEIAQEIADLETELKPAQEKQKIQRAGLELKSEASSANGRRAEALVNSESEAIIVAMQEGRLKALRIKHESLNGISNAISSFLNAGR